MKKFFLFLMIFTCLGANFTAYSPEFSPKTKFKTFLKRIKQCQGTISGKLQIPNFGGEEGTKAVLVWDKTQIKLTYIVQGPGKDYESYETTLSSEDAWENSFAWQNIAGTEHYVQYNLFQNIFGGNLGKDIESHLIESREDAYNALSDFLDVQGC